MNILHIDYDDYDNPYAGGGQAVTTREIYGRLAENRVTVITGNFPGAKNKTIGSLTYKRVGLGKFGPKISLLSFWLFMPFYVFWHQWSYDLVVEFFTAPFSVSLTPFFTFKPHLAWPTALFGEDLGKKYHSPFETIEKIGIKYYKHFVASTEQMEKDLRRINSRATVDVIPYGFDKRLLTIRGSEKDYAIYVGRIDLFQKGIDLLLRAWSILAQEGIKTKLVIVGNGKPDDEQQLRELIRSLHLTQQVILKGRIFGAARDKLVAESKFVICPSRYETYCIMALEALAMGKPLVYSDIKGFSWVPGDIAVPFTSDDAKSLAEKCTLLLTNPYKRTSFSDRARMYAKQYNWDNIAEKYEHVYKQLTPNAYAPF